MSVVAELRQYQTRVEEAMKRALETGVPEVFENEGPEHARIVMDTMLLHAKRSLDVVAGVMDSCTWSVYSLRQFLDRSVDSRVRVLLSCDPHQIPSSSVLHEIGRHQRVEVARVPLDVGRHFSVVDEQHVRLEYNMVSRAASVTFADPNGVGRALSSLFERMWGASMRQKTTVPRQREQIRA